MSTESEESLGPQPSGVPPGWMRSSVVNERLGLRWSDWKHWWKLALQEGRDWMRDPDLVRGNPQQACWLRPEIEPVLAALMRGDLDLAGAQKVLAGEASVPEPIALPQYPPEVEEELEVVSRPKLWPSGRASHFVNPLLVQARRASGELVYVRVAASGCFTPRQRDGQPMKLRARWQGEPRHWTLVGRLPRGVGLW